jgi:chemotaxis protein CheD
MNDHLASLQKFDEKKTLVVRIGDLRASNEPRAEGITYSLGSCVGVSIHDPIAKVGGILHALLPSSAVS